MAPLDVSGSWLVGVERNGDGGAISVTSCAMSEAKTGLPCRDRRWRCCRRRRISKMAMAAMAIIANAPTPIPA